jgi:hypothetical protein
VIKPAYDAVENIKNINAKICLVGFTIVAPVFFISAEKLI